MLSIEGNFGRTLPTGSVSQRKRHAIRRAMFGGVVCGARALPRLIAILITAYLSAVVNLIAHSNTLRDSDSDWESRSLSAGWFHPLTLTTE